jgi:hypothetical protein
MSAAITPRLEALRADFERVTGAPFSHFVCPITFRDDDVPLCRAHIVNAAFPRSSRRRTIQRKDVDEFFGSIFEADFLGILYSEGLTPDQVLLSRELSRQFRPRIVLDGRTVEYFHNNGVVPAGFTKAIIEGRRKTASIALKMSPPEIVGRLTGNWQIRVDKDMRLATLVAALKAAHLTLFDMLGYRYALCAGGHFLGHEVLGSFFLANAGQDKAAILGNAVDHFRQFGHMVRPVGRPNATMRDTVNHRLLYLCRTEQSSPWAMVVMVRTSSWLHAVLAPIFEDESGIVRFLSFIGNSEERIEAYPCEFHGTEWVGSREPITLHWPKTGVLAFD